MLATAAAVASHNLADTVHDLIHSSVPHSSAVLDLFSFGTVIFAATCAGLWQLHTRKRWPPEQYVRIGFASAPLPVYMFLPLLPWDHDLAPMFEDERLLLAFAAICGFMWTLREIRSLFKEERNDARRQN